MSILVSNYFGSAVMDRMNGFSSGGGFDNGLSSDLASLTGVFSQSASSHNVSQTRTALQQANPDANYTHVVQTADLQAASPQAAVSVGKPQINAENAQKLSGHAQGIKETRNRALSDAQDAKTQVQNAVKTVAESVGMNGQDAVGAVTPKAPSNAVSAIGAVATQTLGPAFDIASAVMNIHSQSKGLKPGEKAALMDQAVRQMNTPPNPGGGPAGSGGQDIMAPLPDVAQKIDVQGAEALLGDHDLLPEIKTLDDDLKHVEKLESENRFADEKTQFLQDLMDSEAAISSMTSLQDMSGLQVSAGGYVFDQEVLTRLRPDAAAQEQLGARATFGLQALGA